MSGDNEKPKEVKLTEPLAMTIFVEQGKSMQVKFPFLHDRVVTYGFLKMAEKVLDAHYAQKPKIVSPKGGIMDFARFKR